MEGRFESGGRWGVGGGEGVGSGIGRQGFEGVRESPLFFSFLRARERESWGFFLRSLVYLVWTFLG